MWRKTCAPTGKPKGMLAFIGGNSCDAFLGRRRRQKCHGHTGPKRRVCTGRTKSLVGQHTHVGKSTTSMLQMLRERKANARTSSQPRCSPRACEDSPRTNEMPSVPQMYEAQFIIMNQRNLRDIGLLPSTHTVAGSSATMLRQKQSKANKSTAKQRRAKRSNSKQSKAKLS